MNIKILCLVLVICLPLTSMNKRPAINTHPDGYGTEIASSSDSEMQSPAKQKKNNITEIVATNISPAGCQITVSKNAETNSLMIQLLSTDESFNKPGIWNKDKDFNPTVATKNGIYIFLYNSIENKIEVHYFKGNTDPQKKYELVQKYDNNPRIRIVIDTRGIPKIVKA
jgi:hypothetical protein